MVANKINHYQKEFVLRQQKNDQYMHTYQSKSAYYGVDKPSPNTYNVARASRFTSQMSGTSTGPLVPLNTEVMKTQPKHSIPKGDYRFNHYEIGAKRSPGPIYKTDNHSRVLFKS